MKFDEGTKGSAPGVGELITCDVEIMSGTPVFKNTRVPIKNLIDYLGTGRVRCPDLGMSLLCLKF